MSTSTKGKKGSKVAISTEVQGGSNVTETSTSNIATATLAAVVVLCVLTAKDAVPPDNTVGISNRSLRALPILPGTVLSETAASADDHVIPTWELARTLFKTPVENRPADIDNGQSVIILDHKGTPVACRVQRINQNSVKVIPVNPDEKAQKGNKTYFLV